MVGRENISVNFEDANELYLTGIFAIDCGVSIRVLDPGRRLEGFGPKSHDFGYEERM